MTHLQKVILMIANDIGKILQENNIPYFLDGGTALGAIRHNGFIPWDDDFDIIILPEDYDKFVDVCRNKLDKNKYKFEEAFVDWPLHISKIKLLNTSIKEVDAFQSDCQGIYIDIFCFDNSSNNKLIRYKQFIFGRLLVAAMLSSKGYTANTIKKKFAIYLCKILTFKPIFKIIRSQTKSDKRSDYLAMTWARSRKNWTRYFCKRSLFNSSVHKSFEDYQFPICKGYDEYLKICFGDYMKLPPVEKRVGLHVISVDFGNY